VSRMEAVASTSGTEGDTPVVYPAPAWAMPLIDRTHPSCAAGGFVRDWIVGARSEAPTDGSPPTCASWGSLDGGPRGRPELHEALVPQDLDIQVWRPSRIG